MAFALEKYSQIFNWFTHFVLLPSQRGCTESTINISTFGMNSANSISIFTKYLHCSAVNRDFRCFCCLFSVFDSYLRSHEFHFNLLLLICLNRWKLLVGVLRLENIYYEGGNTVWYRHIINMSSAVTIIWVQLMLKLSLTEVIIYSNISITIVYVS